MDPAYDCVQLADCGCAPVLPDAPSAGLMIPGAATRESIPVSCERCSSTIDRRRFLSGGLCTQCKRIVCFRCLTKGSVVALLLSKGDLICKACRSDARHSSESGMPK